MNKVIRTLVVDDHPLFAIATKNILEEIDGLHVIGIVGEGDECLEFVRLHEPDLIFLDYYLPDQLGSEVAAQIKNQFPHIHVVIFTGVDVAKILNVLLEIGVSGVISKGSSEKTIKNMVQCILDNHTTVPLSFYHKMRLMDDHAANVLELTKDEVQIMSFLVEGLNHEQIGEKIFVSKRTVDNYMKRIYGKLGAKTRTKAVEKFVQSKYYKESDRRE
ncbi:MAG: Two-component response regulator ComA [Bacilli bacterium]|nr:Two-component response regulator ComA [Bacilli bacterium]